MDIPGLSKPELQVPVDWVHNYFLDLGVQPIGRNANPKTLKLETN